MIAHVSIPASDPKAAALLFAELIGGEAFAFPVVPGAWIAIAADGSGTAVEVYPRAMAHHPGEGQPDGRPVEGPKTAPWEDQIFPDGDQLRPSAFHFALSSALSEEDVMSLARRAGLRAIPCDRAGVFKLVELWVDGVLLVEVVCGEEAGRYARFMTPAGAAAMFGPGIRPT